MFKAIGLSGIGFSKGMLALVAAAALAAGSLGVAGHAEARINGDPASPFADMCKGWQDGYDRWVATFYQAETPEELIEARSWVNLYMEGWYNSGCEGAYGDIRFIVSGGGSTFGTNLPNLTVNATPTPSISTLKVAGTTLTTTRTR